MPGCFVSGEQEREGQGFMPGNMLARLDKN